MDGVPGHREFALTPAGGAVEDGTSVNDPGSGSAGIKTVQNSVAEVKVLTTVLPAEYGHSGGGMVSIVKKTGTNEWHGMASIYGRSRRMQHRNYFDRERNSQPTPGNPDGQRNFFLLPDASTGGPVVIPKLYDGRNKTFFFFNWEQSNDHGVSTPTANVPTPLQKTGDFTQTLTSSGALIRIYDPLTTTADSTQRSGYGRLPFAGNLVPVSRFDPIMKKVLGYFPEPTLAVSPTNKDHLMIQDVKPPLFCTNGSTYTDYNKVTDANGEAVLTLPEGNYRFRVDVDGTQFWSGPENHCSNCLSVTITVPEPVLVTVQDTDGTPAAGLNVYAFNGTTYTGFHGTTDQNGQRSLRLQAGSYRFRADLNGTQFWSGTSNHCDVPGCESASVMVSGDSRSTSTRS